MGQFLKVLGPIGLVITIAGCMLDPMVCSSMALGRPRVELAALIELIQLLIGAPNSAHSRIDDTFIREKSDEKYPIGDSASTAADALIARQQKTRRAGSPRAGQGHLGSGSDLDAGRRAEGGGA